jgi:hypothetical protein
MLKGADQLDLINILARSNSLSELVTLSNINISIKFAKDFANDTRDVFKSTRIKAKLTGKMLAHFLASESSVFRG